ncbi:MAG: dihydroxyacetone kinase subunit DhaK, partial [Anaerolineae bacterium]|nr:dihydroxyacetone kinase subunit DhaK [Anaerolineae bacterium]
NYTGDVLSFEMAAELLHGDGIAVQNILVDDDVAVRDSLFTAGRRGVGLTVLMEKIVGAAAAAGYDLDQCADLARRVHPHDRPMSLARRVNQSGRSMGMALTSCIVPANGKPTFDLGADEMEIGIGIHGEPGQKRMPLATVDEITAMLMENILDDGAYTRTAREWDRDAGDWVDVTLTNAPFAPGDQVIALVNSMGGTPLSELYAVYRKVDELCRARAITIVRNLIGPYITSLEMQ